MSYCNIIYPTNQQKIETRRNNYKDTIWLSYKRHCNRINARQSDC